MALDGAFLSCLRQELTETLGDDVRVDKIHQPGKEELILSLRSRRGVFKLYLSAQVSGSRAHITEENPENPAQPPMFCMLLRKKLTGGRLSAIRQAGLERALYFDFECFNELGDAVRLTLASEIMSRYSNLILIDQNGRIIDAIKRVDPEMSSVRPILPGLLYEVPPAEAGRIDLSVQTPADVCRALRHAPDAPLSKAILDVSQGLSPLTCREIAYRATAGQDSLLSALTPKEWEKLEDCLDRVKQAVENPQKRVPYLLTRPDGTPLEYSFQPIIQYGLEARGQEVSSFSALLDTFYARRTAAERMKVKSHDLLRVLTASSERVHRKLQNQRRELEATADRDKWRLYGDLINANMGLIKPGMDKAELINYYDEACATITVPLDPAISAADNARKYYKEYRKAQTAEGILADQIAAGEQELIYIDTVFDALSRAANTRELDALREELISEGYLRKAKGKQKHQPPLKLLTFVSDDGYTIRVGRNNIENDRLTLRESKGSDVWFHVKNAPGSHVVVSAEGTVPPDRTLEQAAILAATHSKMAAGAQVAVDYTLIRYVKKPAGAKPGMVIYTDNRTAFVNPDPALAERLKEQ